MFVAVEDEDGGTPTSSGPPNSSRFFKRDIALLVATAVIGLFFWAIIALVPSDDLETESEPRNKQISDAMASIVEDEHAIILQALKFVDASGIALVLYDKGCQRVLADSAETIQWLNLSGEAMSSIRPVFPGNWRSTKICPMERGGAAIATLLSDGVALSHVSDQSDLVWTQIIGASEPNPDHVVLAKVNQDLLLVTRDRSMDQIQMVSFEPSGTQNWKQVLSATSSIEPVRLAQTSFGDLLVAWREPGLGVRLAIVSPSGLIIQDLTLEDRSLPLAGAAQDEVGKTLLLFGGDQVGIELVSQTGVSERQRSLATSAAAMDVMTYDDTFLIFAVSKSSLMVWGMDALGAISDRVDIEFDAEFVAGAARRINEVEAIVSLQTTNAQSLELVIDLRRLSNALVYEAPDAALGTSVFTIPDGSEASIDARNVPDEIVSAAIEIEVPEEDTQTVADPDPTEIDAGLEVANAINPEPAPEEALLNAPDLPEIEANETPTEAGATSQDAPSTVLPAAPALQVRCTFSCVSNDEPVAEYVLMQTVERKADEQLVDVSLRLNDTHVSLCTLSGGEPEPSFKRECNPG
ncbi:MAG: hypothetical protein AAFV59_06725 [Pseudomonadota bacterium]